MRFFLHLGYNGTPFHGWQRQPNASSVQQTLEEALSTVLRKETAVTGAGRTDTGVNARCMYAHFDADETIAADPRRIINSLNRLCGQDIAVYALLPMTDDAHARFDAVSRTYKYFITSGKNPFLYPLSWHCPSALDMDAMNQCAAILTEVEDFTSFAKLHADTATNICDVTEAVWQPLYSPGSDISLPEEGMVFTIKANRFLRNMVRAVVGTLLDVGRGKLSKNQFREIIERKDRCAAGQSVPPQALYLWDIEYPENIFISNHE